MASSIPISGSGKQSKVRKAIQVSDPGWVTPEPDILLLNWTMFA